MYFAMNKDIDNLDTYMRFLSEIIDGNNEHYRSVFLSILSEVQSFIESKNIYSVSNERFGIVSFLADHKEVVEKLDLKNIRLKDFQTIYDCLKKETALHA
jgi:hypothetical protein